MSDPLSGATPYEILGVPRDASTEELRHAYRRQLRLAHPDTGGDPDAFHRVQCAWYLVGTPAARRVYDARSPRSPRPRPTTPPAPPDGDPRPRTAPTPSTARPRSKARSYGHPGGWSREHYLTLLREWVGRGVDIPDPYDAALVARAPREIQHALANARAEEATALALAELSSGFTIWHDVATAQGVKLDHLILGPTGFIVAQSEDWGARVRRKGKELTSRGLAPTERPVKTLTKRARLTRRWGVRHAAVVLVLADNQLDSIVVPLGRSRGIPRFAIRRSALAGTLTVGLPGVSILTADQLFDRRTRLQERIQFA